MAMVVPNNMGLVLLLLRVVLLSCWLGISNGQMVPAVFVFGDSLVDVGNNNYLEISIAKANFAHNGVDFPGKKATGRFSNGKNAADFLAEKVGLPSSPPYLSISNKSNASLFLTGVSFASGGAGIFDGTDEIYKQSLPLSKQFEYYTTVRGSLVNQLGASSAQKLLSKSLFTIVIGSNDVFGYVGSSSMGNGSSPQQFANQMVASLKDYLKRLHSNDARKFLIVGLGTIGCCPSQRNKNNTECNEAANQLAYLYNQGLVAMLQSFKSELPDMSYSFYDTYSVMQSFIQKPASYGFAEVKAACCGLGNLNAKVACLPISQYCSNRKDHLFWDLYHPTEAASSIFTNDIFDGSSQNTFPLNVRQLIAQ